jgi:hypothetical protein
MKRQVTPELLDSDAGTAEERATALADLRRINRWFGGVSTTRKLIERIVRQTGRRELSLLDVATGSGDVPRGAAQALARTGVRLQVTLADRSPAHLRPGARCVAADAMALPFRDGSFDLVSCGLFAHHLEPEELARFAGEALRVARVAVLINDLRRSWTHLALVYAGLPLYRSRLTRHDAPASVRRAYTPAEIAEILGHTPAARIEIHRSYLCRMGILVWRGAQRRA